MKEVRYTTVLLGHQNKNSGEKNELSVSCQLVVESSFGQQSHFLEDGRPVPQGTPPGTVKSAPVSKPMRSGGAETPHTNARMKVFRERREGVKKNQKARCYKYDCQLIIYKDISAMVS